MPYISLRAEIGFEADLMQGLIEGRIDIGAMYTPQRRPNLELRPLIDDRLVLVASPSGDDTGGPYIYVDWGPEFDAQHSAAYSDEPGPMLSVNVGWLGLRLLLIHGGSGYFPLRMVQRQIAEGSLVRVHGAPEFMQPSWLVCSTLRDREVIDPLMDALSRCGVASADREL
jgi:LysR family transcriptional regulator, flagellar master operon regulator